MRNSILIIIATILFSSCNIITDLEIIKEANLFFNQNDSIQNERKRDLLVFQDGFFGNRKINAYDKISFKQIKLSKERFCGKPQFTPKKGLSIALYGVLFLIAIMLGVYIKKRAWLKENLRKKKFKIIKIWARDLILIVLASITVFFIMLFITVNVELLLFSVLFGGIFGGMFGGVIVGVISRVDADVLLDAVIIAVIFGAIVGASVGQVIETFVGVNCVLLVGVNGVLFVGVIGILIGTYTILKEKKNYKINNKNNQ